MSGAGARWEPPDLLGRGGPAGPPSRDARPARRRPSPVAIGARRQSRPPSAIASAGGAGRLASGSSAPARPLHPPPGAALLASLVLPWYLTPGPGASTLSGWEALSVTDVLLALIALFVLAIPVVAAGPSGPVRPLGRWGLRRHAG